MQLKAKVGNVTQLQYTKLDSSARCIAFQAAHWFNLQTCVYRYSEGARGHVSEECEAAWGRQRLSLNPSVTFQGIHCIFLPGDPSTPHALHMPGLQPAFNISAAHLAYKQPLHFAHILLV